MNFQKKIRFSIFTITSKFSIILVMVLLSVSSVFCFDNHQKVETRIIPLFRSQKYTIAIDYLKKIEDSLRNNNQTDYLPQCYAHLANCYIGIDNYAEAQRYLAFSNEILGSQANPSAAYRLYYHYVQALFYFELGFDERTVLEVEQANFVDIGSNRFCDSVSFLLRIIEGKAYKSQGMIDSMIVSYQKATAFYRTGINLPQYFSKVLSNLAGLLGQTNREKEALGFLREAISIIENEMGDSQEELIRKYYLMGILYKNLQMADSSMFAFDKTEALLEIHPNPSTMARLYSSKASLFGMKGDFEQARLYQENAIYEFKMIKNLTGSTLPKAYNNLGVFYKGLGEYDKALVAFFRSAKYFAKHDKVKAAATYGNCSNCFLALNMLDSAMWYREMELEILQATYEETSLLLATANINMAALCFKANNHNKGLGYLEKGMAVVRDYYPNEKTILAKCYENYAKYQSSIKNYQEAVVFWTKALALYIGAEEPDGLFDIPNRADEQVTVDLARVLKNKAGELIFYATTQDSEEEMLIAAFNHYLEALNLIDLLRQSFLDEESKLFLSANETNTFKEAIDLAVRLFEITQDLHYTELAFELSERSKAANLLASVRSVKASEFGGIPDSLAIKEQQLKSEMARLRKLAHEEKQNSNADKDVVDSLMNQFFKEKKEYEGLISFFGREFPSYHKLKYDNNIANVGKLQQVLLDSANFISYVSSEETMFAFLINKKGKWTFKTPIDHRFEESVQTLINSLTNVDIAAQNRQSLDAFRTVSNYLFSVTIEPLLPYLEGNHLIVSTDESLAYIPFEILCKSTATSGSISFRDLPYLLRDFAISYTYSATLLMEERKVSNDKKNTMAAFAPKYEMNSTGLIDDANKLASELSYLYPLPEAYDEAIKISDLTHGVVYKDQEASEKYFRKEKDHHDILHFAMHAIIENADPMFSKLVFSQNGDSTHDGLLHTYEIYNMKIPARLSVLSACNTGDGVMRKGEGVMSFARSFIYAGCPSVIMTMWPVQDKAGSGIMIDFYQYLKDGNDIDQSLRLAKLDYLNNADPIWAHPYFWAEYVLIGENQQLFKGNSMLLYFLLGGGLIVGVFIVLFFRRKKVAV